jgi:hypothetical protein
MAGPINTSSTIDTSSPTEVPTATGFTADTAEMADLIAIVLALKSIDENLQKAYDAYIAKNKAQFIAYVKASKFYQDYNSTARTRAIAEKEQPGVWQQDKDKYVEEQKQRIIAALGAGAWNATVQKQVEDAYSLGFSNSARDNNILDKLVASAIDFKKAGGAGITSINELKQFADSYGVSGLFGDKYWEDQNSRLFLGETTGADIQEDIKTQAINAYPAFAAGFQAGKSLDLQAGWIKAIVAKNTGVDPNSLRWDDPAVSPWLGYRDAKSGQYVVPSIEEVQTGTRAKFFDAFANTPEGTSYLDGLTVKALQDMGLM